MFEDVFRIGIDLGGTKIEGVCLDDDNQVIFRKRIPTGRENGYSHILNQIYLLYEEIKNFIDNHPHTLGIGTPGAINRLGVMKNSNTQCLNGQPFLADLKRTLNRSLTIENDANCFTLAESLIGAGRGKRLIFGVILGTGCGGGIVYKGELLKGNHSLAGEWGHTVVNPQGADCYCGKKGCVETFLSGTAIEFKYSNKTGKMISVPEIIEEYRQKMDPATEIFTEFLNYFGKSLANVINILEPNLVILGGGLSNIEELYTLGVEEVRANIFGHEWDGQIVKNSLGDSAGVLGAALVGVESGS